MAISTSIQEKNPSMVEDCWENDPVWLSIYNVFCASVEILSAGNTINKYYK